jgi:hypothetical protein
MPPCNPYLPFRFIPTATDRPERRYRQWLSVAELLADELVRRGIWGTIALCPGLIDGWPSQWRGMDVSLRYTFITHLPINEQNSVPSVRRNIRKAQNAGYFPRRSSDWDAIVHCLDATAKAKGFTHRISSDALRRCHVLLGDEHLRGYLGFNSMGNPVSGALTLHLQAGTAIGWFAGTLRSELNSGIVQLLYSKELADLSEVGAAALDYIGANIPVVAASKTAWGFPLVPYLTIQSCDIRYLAKATYQVGKLLIKRR